MGRPKKPRELAVLDGTVKTHPERYRPTPKHGEAVGEAPDHLDDDARACWYELAESAIPGSLTLAERIPLEITANLLAEYRAAPRDCAITKVNALNNMLSRFGMTPVDRAKLGVASEKKSESPFAKLKPIR